MPQTSLMPKIYNTQPHRKDFSCGNHKWHNMLLECLDHAVDEHLADKGSEGEGQQVAQELWMLKAEDEHGFELVAEDEVD